MENIKCRLDMWTGQASSSREVLLSWCWRCPLLGVKTGHCFWRWGDDPLIGQNHKKSGSCFWIRPKKKKKKIQTPAYCVLSSAHLSSLHLASSGAGEEGHLPYQKQGMLKPSSHQPMKPPPAVHPAGIQEGKKGSWRQRVRMYVRGITAVGPYSGPFPYIEEH